MRNTSVNNVAEPCCACLKNGAELAIIQDRVDLVLFRLDLKEDLHSKRYTECKSF